VSWLKGVSLISGVLTMVLVTVVVWLSPMLIGALPMRPLFVAPIVGVAGATVVGAAVLLLLRKYERENARLARYLESLGKPGEKNKASFRCGVDVVARAAEQALGAGRERIEQLSRERRELEVQVRIAESQRREVEAILNTIADGVIVTDAFNEVAIVNESASRIFAFDLPTAARQPVDRVIADPALVKLIKDTREGGHSALRRHIEHRIGDNGSTSVYDVTLACVAEGEDPHEAAGVVTILRDITREKEIAEMKSDFVSNVSHELRTPLSSIKAYVEMLVDGEAHDDQTQAEFYNIIQGETNRLSRLIDNILNISRIESGVVKVQREHVALPALIKEVIDVMQPQARAKQITLHFDPPPLYFQVFADKDMIYQATLNLIGNAIKYTSDEGRVDVTMEVDEHSSMVQVGVRDTGLGIPECDVPHLFEKFYRVKDHKKVAKGTGLGLNLVKHIIETVHGGEVGVTSKVNEGSQFTFRLPLAENHN